MKNSFAAKQSIDINATPAEVWEALVSPEMIKKYLFGTEAVSDWKVGSSITYRGEWKGKAYEDKGKILQIEPQKILQTTYWSSAGGLEDVPENYNTVTYELAPAGDVTTLTITQDNIASEESKKHSEGNWGMVLKSIKELLEK